MSLQNWKDWVLLEYKKIKAFSMIEYNKRKQKEWEDNWNKLDVELEQIKKVEETSERPKWEVPIRKKTCYLKKCSPIPRGNYWILINSNIKCPKNEENLLYNVPYIADDEKANEFIPDLLNCYDGKILDNQPKCLMEDSIFVNLVERLEKRHLDSKSRTTDSKSLMFQAISLHFFNGTSPNTLMQKYDDLVEQKTCIAIKSNSKREDNFSRLFCERCFIYACNLHANGERSLEPQYSDSSNFLIKSQQPCGKDCYMSVNIEANNDSQANNGPHLFIKVENQDWDSEELELFKTLRHIFKDNYCAIASSMPSKTCKQIYQKFMETYDEMPVSHFKSSAKLKKISRAKKTRVLYSAHLRTNDNHKLFPYTPCNHPENQSCNEDCICIKTQNFCEKFCKCHPDLCRKRYIGCICKTSCNSNKCLCYSYGRECDPDLCKSCGACELETNEFSCQNINMQRGFRKQLLLAPSDVAGWGIFSKDSVKKDDYITEYCGEIITQEEANRRGKLYDSAKCSFLFDLNEEFVIDSTRMGSKVRFANHSDDPNCYVKILKVLGDHRIGIFAKRDILAGEELFFDYKYGPNERLQFFSS